jgi:hypothetical protein
MSQNSVLIRIFLVYQVYSFCDAVKCHCYTTRRRHHCSSGLYRHISIQRSTRVSMWYFLVNGLEMQGIFHGPQVHQICIFKFSNLDTSTGRDICSSDAYSPPWAAVSPTEAINNVYSYMQRRIWEKLEHLWKVRRARTHADGVSLYLTSGFMSELVWNFSIFH